MFDSVPLVTSILTSTDIQDKVGGKEFECCCEIEIGSFGPDRNALKASSLSHIISTLSFASSFLFRIDFERVSLEVLRICGKRGERREGTKNEKREGSGEEWEEREDMRER